MLTFSSCLVSILAIVLKVTSIGMGQLKKKSEEEIRAEQPRSGLQLGDLMPQTSPKWGAGSYKPSSAQTANPGSGMGYQDKVSNVSMQQNTPQFRGQAPVAQPAGLPQPARMRNPAAMNQPVRPNMPGAMGMPQPTRHNLGQQQQQTSQQGSWGAADAYQANRQQAGPSASDDDGSMDHAREQLRKADNISKAARRVPAIGMPFPGCHGISERMSYAAFVIQPGEYYRPVPVPHEE